MTYVDRETIFACLIIQDGTYGDVIKKEEKTTFSKELHKDKTRIWETYEYNAWCTKASHSGKKNGAPGAELTRTRALMTCIPQGTSSAHLAFFHSSLTLCFPSLAIKIELSKHSHARTYIHLRHIQTSISFPTNTHTHTHTTHRALVMGLLCGSRSAGVRKQKLFQIESWGVGIRDHCRDSK